MNNEELLELNALGLIPSPEETKEDFLVRADYCLKLKDQWKDFIPFDFPVSATAQFFEEPLKKTKKLFDISPTWVPIVFSNHQLMPWHGGSAWIFQESDELPTSAFFQLKPIFERKQTYLKMYTRDELMAHEMSHIGRMMFQEPKFEELIAYQTSHSSFRRFFGSIIQSSKESLFFMMSLFLILFLDLFFLAFNYTEVFALSTILKLVPFSLIVFGCIRLWRHHQTFLQAKEHLKPFVKVQEMVDAVIYRLQDAEIELFSKSTEEEIRAYIEQKTCLRWHVIKLAYL